MQKVQILETVFEQKWMLFRSKINWFFIYSHHTQVGMISWSSMTLSHHLFLSSITFGRDSRSYTVFAQLMYSSYRKSVIIGASLLWRRNMTSYYILRVVGEGGRRPTIVASKNLKTLVVSGIMEREAVSLSLSLQTSLSLQGDMGMREPHSQLTMHVSAEKQTFDYVRRKKLSKKANTWWIFKLRRLVSCCLFTPGWRRIISYHLVVKVWRRMKICRFFVGEWRHVVWNIKETQIPK